MRLMGRGQVPLLLDGPRGNLTQYISREQVKSTAAQSLDGSTWDERVLDIVLAQMDANVGPPLIGRAVACLYDLPTSSCGSRGP